MTARELEQLIDRCGKLQQLGEARAGDQHDSGIFQGHADAIGGEPVMELTRKLSVAPMMDWTDARKIINWINDLAERGRACLPYVSSAMPQFLSNTHGR